MIALLIILLVLVAAVVGWYAYNASQRRGKVLISPPPDAGLDAGLSDAMSPPPDVGFPDAMPEPAPESGPARESEPTEDGPS